MISIIPLMLSVRVLRNCVKKQPNMEEKERFQRSFWALMDAIHMEIVF